MRVSEYFNLNKNQSALDFVDVDIENDLKVFIDPRALLLLKTEWGQKSVFLIQDFFHSVINYIHIGQEQEALRLLEQLVEPNETHFGYSDGKSRGTCFGPGRARKFWEALVGSEAVKTGLIQDLEDTALMIEGVDKDIISDIVTNIIRSQLIIYTKEKCEYYGIPTSDGIDSGPIWDPSSKDWNQCFVDLPVIDGKKILLIPKFLVRRKLDYNYDEYYRNYILEFLRTKEYDAKSGLIEILKNGNTRITNKSLKSKYGYGKSVVIEQTLKEPSILDKYRSEKKHKIHEPLNHYEIAELADISRPNWRELLENVTRIEQGRENAYMYENAIEELLSSIFYPALANPSKQTYIHEGRKKIDITYSNVATKGFFYWLSNHYPSAFIMVECKNYKGDISNPELDQLAGRFSPSRGQVGLLICRKIENKELFLQRCRDTANDQRGFIIPIDDDDLRIIVEEINENEGINETFGLLQEIFNFLVL